MCMTELAEDLPRIPTVFLGAIFLQDVNARVIKMQIIIDSFSIN